MPTIQVTVDIKEDGQTLAGFPLTKQVTVLESAGRQVFTRISQVGSYNDLPLDELAGVSVLFVQADQPTELRFNDQTVSGLPLAASGFMLLVDGAIPDTATVKASLLNASGSDAQVTQVGAGS